MTRRPCTRPGRIAATLVFGPLLGCAGSTPAPAPVGLGPDPTVATVTYRPYMARYRGITRGHVEQEVNQRLTTSDFRVEYDLTVRLDSSDTGLPVTMVVDSVPTVSGDGFADSQADRLRGATFVGALEPTGTLVDFHEATSTTVEPVTELVTRALQEFFPALPADGARPGDEWLDTLVATSTLGGIEITQESFRRHTIHDWTMFNDIRALEIRSRVIYTLNGAGDQFGQEFTLAGQGRRSVYQYMSAEGQFLGRVVADTSEAEVELGIGRFIPIRQTRADTVSIRS